MGKRATALAITVYVLLGASATFGQVTSQDKPPAERDRAAVGVWGCRQSASPLEDERVPEKQKNRTEETPAYSRECSPATVDLMGPALRQVSFLPPTGSSSVSFDPVGEGAGHAASGTQAGSGASPQPSAEAAELAKKLSNPVASLISVPFQHNFDFNMGPDDKGFRYTMNFQPVIPFSLNEDWNLISRTIVPFIHQDDVVGTSSQTGLGDVVQSLFFSPVKTDPFIWGVGPVFLLPTATDELLGTEKFGLGPTVVILKQQKGWTYGALLNHIWSVAGDNDRADVNSTFLQPFLSYTTKTAWTYTLNTESTYDWTGEQWSVPIHFQVSKLVRFGKQPVSFGGSLRCWATSPANGPEGCGFRVVVTLLFPK